MKNQTISFVNKILDCAGEQTPTPFAKESHITGYM